MINKIRQAFGLNTEDKKTNYAQVETGGASSAITHVEEQPISPTRIGRSNPGFCLLNKIYKDINRFTDQEVRDVLDEIENIK